MKEKTYEDKGVRLRKGKREWAKLSREDAIQAPLIAEGTRVLLKSLVNRSELNGLECVVKEYDANEQRYTVRTVGLGSNGAGQILSIKPTCLSVIQAQPVIG